MQWARAVKPLRVGLLLETRASDAYTAVLCDWLAEHCDLELALVLVTDGAPPGRVGRQRRPAAQGPTAPQTAPQPSPRTPLLFAGVMALERQLLRHYEAHRAHLDLVDVAALAAARGVPVRSVAPPSAAAPDPASAASAAAPDAALPAISDPELAGFDLDLLVCCDGVTCDERLGGAARLGAIGIDYRRDRIAGGAPIGFWETYHRTRKTGFAIVRLGRPGEAGQVLVEGAFRTKYSFLLNQAHLFCKAHAQLRRLLDDVAATRKLPAVRDPVPYSGCCLASPGSLHALRYAFKLAGRLGMRGLRRILGIRHKWTLSVTRSGWRNAVLWRGVPVAAPDGHFWADPFLRVHAGRIYCFVEDYVYATNRAHISVLEITQADVKCLGVALREPFHLSFPFLFEYAGRLYMCPETSESNQIRIYKCDEFPLRWSLDSVAIDGISAADSMFFEHRGRWWLLTSIDRAGLNDHCSELCLFHAPDPLGGAWTPHPMNPLYIDTDMGRNAGLIVDEGRIYRAAQRQGFDQYGEGLALYEIIELDETRYSERKVTDIRHDYLQRSLGSHHISSDGDVTVVDIKTHCFAP
ncbi:glucosamine inositolphosphorylceramide transferase family protein [Massilia timonae]|uniref:Glucosamine inositolphosphorylceramide transferase 1 N-terminal domain-containing protein n=1 Tax=Massilia timonae TaxID=47229 RepID=A0A1S2N3I7_9BURK|nr:hypothetical protein [Massilia timonae]OIJ39631.1 hypothetical protein LO55_3497 [Massilia timonae]